VLIGIPDLTGWGRVCGLAKRAAIRAPLLPPFHVKQTTASTSFLRAVTSVVHQGGVLGLFRGASAPIAAALPTNAIIFAAERYALQRMQPHLPPERLSVGASTLVHAAAGAFAGALQLPIAIPAELCKIQLQTRGLPPHSRVPTATSRLDGGVFVRAQSAAAGTGAAVSVLSPAVSAPRRRGGLAMLAAHIVLHHGVGALYRGAAVTAMRDTIAFAAYFATYDGVKTTLTGCSRQATTPELMLAGGLAGVASWLFSYPLDIVKSQVQSAPLTVPRRELTVARVLRERLRVEGPRFLTRGLSTTLVRAFACSAIVFPVFEWLLEVEGSLSPHGHQDEIHR